MSGFKIITEKTDRQINTHKTPKYKAINYYGSEGKIMLLEIIKKHMIYYDFLYLFLNQRTYSLMHTVTRND